MAHSSTLRDETNRLKEHLAGIYDPDELESVTDLILEEYLGQSRLFIRTNPDWPVPPDILLRLDQALSRLKDHVPVQYILGKAHFYDLELMVNEHVLIPRPETEELVDRIRKDLVPACEGHPFSILDIGTGSGCIAIALKKLFPSASVSAVDISPDALKVAALNARFLDTPITFRQMDILDPHVYPEFGKFELIVSNPPYVLLSEKDQLNRNVSEYEPSLALFVGDDQPLVFYEAMAAFSREHLLPQGRLYLEINERFGQETVSLFQDKGFSSVELLRDLHGKDRMLRMIK